MWQHICAYEIQPTLQTPTASVCKGSNVDFTFWGIGLQFAWYFYVLISKIIVNIVKLMKYGHKWIRYRLHTDVSDKNTLIKYVHEW